MQQQPLYYPPPYRMVTVWQPWADLLTADADLIEQIQRINPQLAGQLPKDIENRGRGTNWRGTLLIHAAQNLDLLALAEYGLEEMDFVRSAVVGVVHLDAVLTHSHSFWARPNSKYWAVSHPIRLDQPVGCAGVRSAREPAPHVLAAVLARLEHQRIAAHT